MLWLALHLPFLPLDALHQNLTPTQPEPWAVVEQRGRQEQVLICNAAAQALGVKPGMRRAAALTFAAGLRIARRQPQQELALLESLAAWSLQYTPTVCLVPPHGLLLEIEGCLRYFKGLGRLRKLIAQGLVEHGWSAQMAAAPSPLAATWLAQLRPQAVIRSPEGLADGLASLPIAELPWPDDTLRQLQALGMRQFADLHSLPRDGLAHRLGHTFPYMLDQALGLQPDPRDPFEPPDRFERTVALNWATDQIEALGFVAKRLFTELAAFLMGRGLGVQQLQLIMQHEDSSKTEVTLGLGKPTRAADAMLAICRERLARLALPAPVEAMGILASQLHRLDGQVLTLFGDASQAEDFDLLRARLVARLGEDAVQSVVCVADHRPEHAWCWAPCGSVSPPLTLGERPAWLLPEPQSLELRDGHLWHSEPLQLLTRAERIESGWWDGNSVTRDYYQAQGPSGRRYWIYQQRSTDSWYLHGLFA
ncbi:Y-family DNA polymerase [Chitinimonas sp. JJ19]|uniref:Y-family DNA polymerase n=1 Tax=Chitinimonas sp. JJ19 TaxID=3109352 RepID=UPI0030016D96